MKTITKFSCPAFAALALACFAVLSTAQAVTRHRMVAIQAGTPQKGTTPCFASAPESTIPPWVPMRFATTLPALIMWRLVRRRLLTTPPAIQNMAIGAEALRDNNANFNLAIGFRVLFMNTTGNHLTGIGAAALRNNTTASDNTAIGSQAMRENTTGENNTAIGADALSSNTTGFRRTQPTGFDALFSNTTGEGNTATGYEALYNNHGDNNTPFYNGDYNTANGHQALFSNTSGYFNTGIGHYALHDNTTGHHQTAIGNDAMARAGGNGNTATGYAALVDSYGDSNTANGLQALSSNRSGSNNTAVGYYSGGNGHTGVTTGSDNTLVGYSAGANVTTANNVICFGSNVAGANVSNTTWIDGIYGVTTLSGTTAPVIVSADGQLGTVASSERFKKDIGSMEKASEAILSLRPVTFHYKTDTQNTPQFGLIAEEVAKVNPALVLPDKEGKPYTVRYDQVNAMLLNEFLKARHQIDAQQKQIEALTEGLQKVNAQLAAASPSGGGLEAIKPAPQVVNNP